MYPHLARHGPPALQVGVEEPGARVQAASQPQQLGQEPLEVLLVQQQAGRGVVREVQLPLHQRSRVSNKLQCSETTFTL